jgi:GH24 family phage-related lysozyme (muramidase)
LERIDDVMGFCPICDPEVIHPLPYHVKRNCKEKVKHLPERERAAVLMGDCIEEALNRVGITKELVAKWIGNCGCAERQWMFNELHLWAIEINEGRRRGAVRKLRRIIKEYRKKRKEAKRREKNAAP